MRAKTVYHVNKAVKNTALHLIAVLSAFLIVAPFLWMLSTSLKPSSDIFLETPKFIPSPLSVEHYFSIFQDMAIHKYFLNSVIVASTSTLIAVTIAVFGGYSLARHNMWGVKMYSGVVLFTYILPSMMLVIPLFIILSKIGLINTKTGLIVTNVTLTLPYSLWMLSAFFQGPTRDLEEAAIVDGCSKIGALFRITLPLSMPGVIAVALYCFTMSWNDYIFAVTILSSQERMTLPLAIASIATQYDIEWGGAMAASVLATIPVVVFFMFFQKYLVKGMTSGAIKG